MTLTGDICRARAEEAETLSRTVAYGPDRERLRGEAARLRAQATRIDAHEADWRAPPPPPASSAFARWLFRR